MISVIRFILWIITVVVGCYIGTKFTDWETKILITLLYWLGVGAFTIQSTLGNSK